MKVEYSTDPGEVVVSDIKKTCLGAFKPLKIDAFSYLSRKNPISASREKKTFFLGGGQSFSKGFLTVPFIRPYRDFLQ